MKLGDSKAIKTSQWFANEILRNDDINVIGKSAYQNITDQTALLFVDELDAGEQDFVIGRGLRLLWDNLLTTNLQIGRAISTKGAYLNSDVWGYIADPGGIFSVIVPVTQSVAFSTGGTFARIDILEVRPIEFEYNSVSRNFKDPITGLVSSAVVATRKEYGYEFAVREGDDTTVLTKEVTTFTVNATTVGSDIAGKYILFSTIYNNYYVWYNTGASSDPEVSGRTGIEVSIGAADDKDAIASATRSAITVAGVVVSGATNQIILTGSTFANLTDGTNGDTTTYFDAISITQGNGALSRTAGWIKIAEVDVGASASAIDQDDIRNVDESDQWENDPDETLFLRRPAKDVKIDDTAGRFTATEVESALAEIAGSGRTTETVKQNQTDLIEGVPYYDLVIDSVADLNLLKSGTSEQYKKVYVKEGSYTTGEILDLYAHGVELIRGALRDTTTISFASNGGNFVRFGYSTKMKNLSIKVSVGGTPRSILIPYDPADNDACVRNVKIFGVTSGIGIHTGMTGFRGATRIRALENIEIYDCLSGFETCTNLVNCFAHDNTEQGFLTCEDLVNCRGADNTIYGFDSCNRLSNCYATGNVNGFDACDFLSTCKAISNTDDGFRQCNFLSSCHTTLNSGCGYSWCENLSACYSYVDGLDAFEDCLRVAACRAENAGADGFHGTAMITGSHSHNNTGYDYNNCDYVSGSKAFSTGASYWNACTKVDNDSCNYA